MRLTVQFITLITTIGMGIALGMSLDTYQLLLRMHLDSKWKKAINDLLFWMLYSVLFFYVLYIVNEGSLRFYVFLAILCGYAMYRSLLEQIYVYVLMKIVRFIQKTLEISIKIFKKLILNPIRWIIMFVYSSARFLFQIILRVGRKVIKWIYLLTYTIVKWILLVLWALLPKKVKQALIYLYGKVRQLGFKCIALKGKVIILYRKVKNALRMIRR